MLCWLGYPLYRTQKNCIGRALLQPARRAEAGGLREADLHGSGNQSLGPVRLWIPIHPKAPSMSSNVLLGPKVYKQDLRGWEVDTDDRLQAFGT